MRVVWRYDRLPTLRRAALEWKEGGVTGDSSRDKLNSRKI